MGFIWWSADAAEWKAITECMSHRQGRSCTSLHLGGLTWCDFSRARELPVYDSLHHSAIKAIGRMLLMIYYILQNASDCWNSSSSTEGTMLDGHFVTDADFHSIHRQSLSGDLLFTLIPMQHAKRWYNYYVNTTFFSNAAILTTVPMAFRCCYHYKFAFWCQKKKAYLLMHSISYRQ